EVDQSRAERRRRQGFLDEIAPTLDDALQVAQRSLRDRTPHSIALVANAADVLPELVRRGVRVDVVTDQTSAHDPLDGYVPAGDASDIHRTDRLVLELFPENETLARWIRLAQDRVPFQGLPARVCWLGYGERALFGERIDELVERGEIKAPIVIGRDHLDSGSVASPFRETEGMKDGSDAIADWPILNALVNASAGATWVSVHHGGGVVIGNAIHAGMV